MGSRRPSMLETVSIEEQIDELRPEPRWELASFGYPNRCEGEHRARRIER
jgi:hypothetical protein